MQGGQGQRGSAAAEPRIATLLRAVRRYGYELKFLVEPRPRSDGKTTGGNWRLITGEGHLIVVGRCGKAKPQSPGLGQPAQKPRNEHKFSKGSFPSQE